MARSYYRLVLLAAAKRSCGRLLRGQGVAAVAAAAAVLFGLFSFVSLSRWTWVDAGAWPITAALAAVATSGVLFFLWDMIVTPPVLHHADRRRLADLEEVVLDPLSSENSVTRLRELRCHGHRAGDSGAKPWLGPVTIERAPVDRPGDVIPCPGARASPDLKEHYVASLMSSVALSLAAEHIRHKGLSRRPRHHGH